MQLKANYEVKRLATIWGVLLTVLILFSGGYVYQQMEQQSKTYLSRGLEALLQNKVQLYVNKLTGGNGINDSDIRMLRRPLIETLENSDNQSILSRNEILQSIADQYMDNNFLATSFYDSSSNEVAHAGEFSENAIISFNVESLENTLLVWNGQFILRVTNEIYRNKVYLGKVVSEKSLPKLTETFLNFTTISTTGEFAICKLLQSDDTKMQCVVNGFEGKKYFQQQPRIVKGKPLPMSHALDGNTGLIYSKDYRNEKVVAAYSPVNKLGLGFVFKIDQDELYSPLTGNLSFIIPVLIVLIIFGILLLHWLVTPLIRNLISSQKEAIISNSELRKQKNLHQLVLDYSPYCIHEIDNKGLIVSMNPIGLAMLNAQTEREVINTSYLDGVSKEDNDRVSQLFADGLQGKSSTFEYKDPNGRTYQSSFVPIQNKERDILRLMGWSQDITERKENEAKLRLSQKIDAIGNLTGGIAHDYNNMLGIIIGYSELLKNKLTDIVDKGYADEIHKAGTRGAKLTKELLSFSKQGSQDLEVVNLNNVLELEKDMLSKFLTLRIKFVFDLSDDIWQVSLDKSALEDAILNLSINAMHAMEKGGMLTFQTANQSLTTDDATHYELEAGDYVFLSMTDTGSGMDEATQSRIFEPFFTTKDEFGTGLGLSQVYGFMKLSNGAVSVSSKPSVGTTITMIFPRNVSSQIKGQLSNTIDKKKLSGNETLLIVDDEQALVALNSEILKSHGYTVFTANDGEQAMKVLENESIDLLLSDVIMPGTDGYRLAARVNQMYPHIKIQLISGYSDNINRDSVDESLQKNMLNKPITEDALLMRIRSLLDMIV